MNDLTDSIQVPSTFQHILQAYTMCVKLTPREARRLNLYYRKRRKEGDSRPQIWLSKCLVAMQSSGVTSASPKSVLCRAFGLTADPSRDEGGNGPYSLDGCGWRGGCCRALNHYRYASLFSAPQVKQLSHHEFPFVFGGFHVTSLSLWQEQT